MHSRRYRTRTIPRFVITRISLFSPGISLFFLSFPRHFPFHRVYFLYSSIKIYGVNNIYYSIDAIISSIYEPSVTGYLILRNNGAKLEKIPLFFFCSFDAWESENRKC